MKVFFFYSIFIFAPKWPVYNYKSFVEIIAWSQTHESRRLLSAKSLPETMMA